MKVCNKNIVYTYISLSYEIVVRQAFGLSKLKNACLLNKMCQCDPIHHDLFTYHDRTYIKDYSKNPRNLTFSCYLIKRINKTVYIYDNKKLIFESA